MSDAPGQGAAVPPVAVVVDSPVGARWVSDSIAALSRRYPDLLVLTAAESGRLGARTLVVDLSTAQLVRPDREQVVLSVRHGTSAASSARALVRELVSGRSTVTTTVVARGAESKPTVVAAARSAVTRSSLAGSRDRAAAKVPALLLRGVERVLEPERPSPILPPAAEPIGAFDLALGAGRLIGATLRSSITSLTTVTNYAVAWGERSPADSPLRVAESMHWVEHPSDRFLADPFLARDGARTFVFVEDFSRRSGYATIGVFEPRRGPGSFRTVLDRGTHISYPFVFRDGDGDWLMLPETAAEQRITLFRAAPFPDAWVEDTVLIENVRAYDPTLCFHDGTYWLFYASGTPGSALDDELHLASSSSLRGPYVPHPANPVKTDVIGSRPAGRLFHWNGRLIRPAQDSAREYGYAVVFNEVTALTTTTFAEEPIGRLEPGWVPGNRGSHTWDFLDDIVVVDAKRARRRRGALRPRRSR